MSFRKKTVLYFAPHQDDELLSMGIDICASLKKNHDVHVILCADGSKSYVRGLLNNGKACAKHEGIHQYNLSVEDFIKARDREFTGSCLALGVPEGNIHIPEKRAVDGSLYVSYGEALIRSFLSRFDADVEICTISPSNGPSQHSDHRNIGQAAENLLKAGVIRKVRFFIEPYLFEKIKDNPQFIPVAPTIQQASSSVARKISAAVDSYSLWQPEQQRYAVGYHSVTTEFRDFLQTKTCYSFEKYHPASMTKGEQLRERHRQWLKRIFQK